MSIGLYPQERSGVVDLTYKDFIAKLGSLGQDEWVSVYLSSDYNKEDSPCFYSALISKDRIKKILSNPSWDLHIGDGAPGFSFVFKNGKEIGSYYRFAENGVEPLVLVRSFNGMKKGYCEISEEFRMFFNLFYDSVNNKYVLVDDNGDDEDVIVILDSEVKIKTRIIKEFISAKKMKLVIYFDITRYSTKKLEDLGLKESEKTDRGDDFVYSLWLRGSEYSIDSKRQSLGLLMGKKVISGLPDYKPKLFDKDEKYVDFIIGLDENGKERLFTCNEDKLANYFGKNPDSPHYLTPVLFKKDVLTKYYSQPEKYSVEDGYLRCGGMWGLYIDNNHPNYVMVFLGDLGKLTYKEQLYWRGFNVSAKGTISHVAWQRSFMGEFTNPEKSDLFFKQKFDQFQKKWKEKYGWNLFIPLSPEDQHYFSSLRIPLTNEQKEFDEQVLSIAKVLIDSLNEKELGRSLELDKNTKGINKLELFLRSKNLKIDEMIKFLKDLQSLRSTGVAHRKGQKYENLKKTFSIGEKDLSLIFDDIIVRCIWVLNTLESHFLDNAELQR